MLALLLAESCAKNTPQITMPVPQPPSIVSSLDAGDLWGVADLHAHPASHLAFGGTGGNAGLIWGSPALPDGTQRYVSGGDLPDILACDPEAHASSLSDEVSLATRAQVFEALTQTTLFPHAPRGGPASGDGDPNGVYESWPNGRDVLHQAMNIQAIRRAFEGGLRLMIASTVDSQPIALTMTTQIFPQPFTPSRAAERASAEEQLQYIHRMVEANADWMEIASTPEQAEAAIRGSRLAVVPGLEMDGLLLSDIQDLVQQYGVGAIVPIHLIDNDVGGTAAYEDLFTSATALMGQMFGYPDRYISVEGDSQYAFRFRWPQKLAISGPAFGISDLDYTTESSLNYLSEPYCRPSSFAVDGPGLRNSVGLRAPETIRELMKLGLLVDVAHMGFRSTAETIALAESTCNYPLVDTHTSVHYADHIGPTGTERDLHEDHANYVASSQGLIGFGTGGRYGLTTCNASDVDTNTLRSARGGPLATFDGRKSTQVIRFDRTPLACQPALDSSESTVGFRVTGGAIPDGALIYARLTFADGHEEQLSLTPGSVTSQEMQEPAANLVSISVGSVDPYQCRYKSSDAYDIDAFQIMSAAGVPLLTLEGPQGDVTSPPAHLATLSSSRDSYEIYHRCAAQSAAICDPASQYLMASAEPVEHLRVSIRSGNHSLRSASNIAVGARVTAALCMDPNCMDADGCDGTVIAPAGGWIAGGTFQQYFPIARTSSPNIAAISMCVTQRDLAIEPWEIDEVRIDSVVDPMQIWAADVHAVQHRIFGDRAGAVALGTDANGLAPFFAFTDYVPSYQTDGAGCGDTAGGAASQYGDASSGGVFTLERPLRIGTQPLCVSQRGVATYGLLPEFFAAVWHYDPSVYRSLFKSAAATIGAWKASRAKSLAFASAPTSAGCQASTSDAGVSDSGPTGEGGP